LQLSGSNWLKRWSGPLVATLHNYRPACAAGTLFRDGKVCEIRPYYYDPTPIVNAVAARRKTAAKG